MSVRGASGMYETVLYEARCDRCGTPHPDGMKDTIAEAKRAAIASGWVMNEEGRRVWLCNTCKEKSRG